MSTTATYRLFVGIDIAAETFTASWVIAALPPRARPITLAQTPDGFAALQQQLQMTGVPPQATLVVLEATGSYWIALAVTLHEAGYHVSVANPAHVCYDAGDGGGFIARERMAEQDVIWRTSEPLTAESLAAQLVAAGLTPGSAAIVHVSLSALGWVVGGAQAVVQALLGAVGPSGTLLMPTQTWRNLDPASGAAQHAPHALVRRTAARG